MTTGKAYAFFDYWGTDEELTKIVGRARVECGFEDLGFEIVGKNERGRLPGKLVSAAQNTRVFGSVKGECLKNNRVGEGQRVFRELTKMKPKPAHSLKYLVIARGPRVEHSRSEGAGKLDTVLKYIASKEYHHGIFRGAVLWRNWEGNYERF